MATTREQADRMTAEIAFDQATTEFDVEIAKLQRLRAARFGATASGETWGHVGDVRFATDRLREIQEHFSNPGARAAIGSE